MTEKNITNVIVMFGGLPETCYSVSGETETEVQEKIQKLINTIYCEHNKIDSPESLNAEHQAKLAEAQDQAAKQENINLDADYEIFFVNSTIV